MPSVDLNFGDVGKIPEEGTYRYLIDKAIFQQNKSKDGFVVNLQMDLIDSPDEKFEGHKVFDNPSFKLSARWKLQEVLQAVTQQEWQEDEMNIEWECEEDCDAETFEECPHKKHVPLLEGKTVLGISYHYDYNQRLTLKIKNYLPDNGMVEIGANSPEE
jgi:hypothetical protein